MCYYKVIDELLKYKKWFKPIGCDELLMDVQMFWLIISQQIELCIARNYANYG